MVYWKGGRKLQGGYIHILKHGYFSSHTDGYVRANIFLFQEFHKCCMLPWGDVHHINGIKTDNRISHNPEENNLEGILKSKHRRLHMLGKKFTQKDMSGRICIQCGSDKTLKNSSTGYEMWHILNGNWLCRSCYGSNYYKNRK